ncbi:MAG TPA: acetyl-CoA carboxylase biotin carboxyl carrier protein [Proteobacteria bacterium]|nr:biotin carboxyl carrier protein of acetyl-CoA carboxylase [bacterium BMS3Abin14]HDL52545.1 acetyl-CoA carboxylase biotin carboxyl carrier protein [Pseudomonadota bacterium]
MELKEIREILKLIEKFGIQDFTLQRGDTKVRIRKGGAESGRVMAPVSQTPPSSEPVSGSITPPVSPEPSESLTVGENQFLVTSPIVGTFYRASAPDKPAYVEVGQVAGKGTVLCIVEAMKIMNEIECEVSGKVSAILVENAQPVEYGEPLFIIDLA